LVRITLLTFSNISNALLQVESKYPPQYPGAVAPLIYQCNAPQYTPTLVTGGHYILNWDGDPTILVNGATWSTVKQLFQ
jgi:hypothetical protein